MASQSFEERLLARVARLEQAQDDLAARDVLGSGFTANHGTAFAGFSTAYPFFRDDLGEWCFYHSTSGLWLTTHEYNIQTVPYTPIVPGSGFYTGGAPANLGYAIPRTDFPLFITRWVIGYISDTIQSGTNFWTVILQAGAATITTQNTQNAITANAMFTREGTDNTNRAPTFFRLQASAKNGAPGGLWVDATVWYRKVIT